MIKIIAQNFIWFTIVFLLGIFFTILLKEKVVSWYKRFISIAPTIRKYWVFVIIFSVLVITSYIFIFIKSPNNNWLNTNLTVLGQISALVFAIFVGYFAFLQVVENRIGKLKEEGFRYFKEKAYSRAIKNYEEIHSIDAKNFNNLAELLELYLIQKDFEKFNKKILLLEEDILDKRDNLIFLYLQIIAELIKEHIAEGKEKILLMIEFQKKNRDTRINWDFSDIKMCPAYNTLTGDTKKYFDNTVKYLTVGMGEEEKTKFENGDYLI